MKWDKIIKEAIKEGFVTMSYGGVAILMSHEVQKEQGIFEKTQKMCNREIRHENVETNNKLF